MLLKQNTMDKLLEARDYLIGKGINNINLGVVLGTGLHQFINKMDVLQIIPYSDIPNFPISPVEFHKGNLIYGKINDKNILVLQGRFHAYEGYSFQEIVFPIRVMKLLGINYLFLSNAAGGINLKFKKGDLVVLEDHINLQSGSPLMGKNLDYFGNRFTDLSNPYSKHLNFVFYQSAEKLHESLKFGTYAAVNGPNLETKAEYRYLKIIGADMVGMSTVPEVIASNHMNLPCAAISVITDECDPDNLSPIDIEEILEVAKIADAKFSNILYETIKAL